MPMVKMVNLHHFSLFVAAILLPPPQPTPMSGQIQLRDLRFDNVPFGRTQFAPTLWTNESPLPLRDLRFDNMPSGWSDSSTERFPGWDIIPTQVPNLRIDG